MLRHLIVRQLDNEYVVLTHEEALYAVKDYESLEEDIRSSARREEKLKLQLKRSNSERDYAVAEYKPYRTLCERLLSAVINSADKQTPLGFPKEDEAISAALSELLQYTYDHE